MSDFARAQTASFRAALLAAAALAPGCATPPPAAREWTPEERAQFLRNYEEKLARREAEDRAEQEIWIAARAETLERTMGVVQTNCHFDEAPFPDVLRYFAERHGVPLVLDEAIRDEVQGQRISMRFEKTTLSRVIVIVAALTGTVAQPEGKGIRFVKRP